MSDSQEDLIVPRKWHDALPRESWKQFERVGTGHSWFEVYRVTTDVYALYEPGQFQEVISYLVLGGERACLVDTGFGMGDMRGLVDELTDLPITVVNTHTHVDHVAENNLFDDVAVFDHPFARENAVTGRDHESVKRSLSEGMVWKPLPEGFNADMWYIPPFRVTRWLHDGDTVDLGGRTLEVHHTPGHSPDSICLLDREARLFWTGDIFYNAPLYVYGATADLDDFIESYRKMVALSRHYNWLLPGHNETYVDKEVLARVFKTAEDIRAGEGGEYREQDRRGTVIHRYDREGFAIIVRAP
ncbi:MAG: MBL fold metallo-hydrolase [Candidatus Bathyarchaeota archaeon]|nr:MAG: MBL fold metallo-hydrolase [Candidatus Bathyarchaeota archaeon]